MKALVRERLIAYSHTDIPEGIGAGELLLLLKTEIARHMGDGTVDDKRLANACCELSNSATNEAVCTVYRQHWTDSFRQYIKNRRIQFEGLPVLSSIFSPSEFRKYNMAGVLAGLQHHMRTSHKTPRVDMFVLQMFEKFASLWYIQHDWIANEGGYILGEIH